MARIPIPEVVSLRKEKRSRRKEKLPEDFWFLQNTNTVLKRMVMKCYINVRVV